MTHERSVRLTAEQLDDRVLMSATMLDLTTRGAVTPADFDPAFIARQVDAQPTGTGHIQSFVRIQGAAAGGGAERGYNTAARPLQFDENKSPQFTRALTLGQVPVVTVGGVAYREFLLDINQKSSSPRLSVDEVKVFLGSQPNLTGYSDGKLAGLSAAFDLDAGPRGDVSLLLNARLNSGSGSGDMTLLIPEANFAGADPRSYVYLYSAMGGVEGARANGGFEEWAVRSAPPASPPPVATSSLSGFVFNDFNGNGTVDPDEGIAGVTIRLMRMDASGNYAEADVVTTGLDGSYKFIGLQAGTYALLEEQPTGYTDGDDFLGDVNGDGQADGSADEAQNDYLYDILLGPNQTGVNYNFAELRGDF